MLLFSRCDTLKKRYNNLKELRTKQAIKRFDEERKGKSIFKSNAGNGYNKIVELLVTGGNSLNGYDIDRIEMSPFAFSRNILDQIRGETTMSWTGFCAKMNDGKTFGFGSRFLFDFFQMPDGYKSTDIAEIINHSYISKAGELKEHKVPFFDWPSDYDEKAVHRERPFFDCYIKGL